MADVKWIKIVTDIFDDEKILLIESLPDADTVSLIAPAFTCARFASDFAAVRTCCSTNRFRKIAPILLLKKYVRSNGILNLEIGTI